MARQKSEDRKGPKDRRKAVPTEGIESARGGKAIPVNEQTRQLNLLFETAEFPAKAGARRGDVVDRSTVRSPRVPKSKSKGEKSTSATMDEVAERLESAFAKVASNKGAPGPDRQNIEEVREHLPEVIQVVQGALLNGTYEPGNIRRVWIPKSGGGERGLGIPNVVDRMVQEAVREVLEPQYEPTFRDESHGFRPKRSCQTAIAAAREHVEAGYGVVVDLDLENFFNRVNHQRLLAQLAERVQDRKLLALIGRMLKAKVVMPDGVLVNTEEGVPQGGPLSPLLSNIVLDELDRELARRGHRFVRYADDCNIYVRSERAGQRVMASVVGFIEKRLRLRVNKTKSAVARPEERHFLGFSLRREADGQVEVLLSKRTMERVGKKILELTPRNWGGSLRACIRGVNGYVQGWIGFFGICTAGAERNLQNMDAHIRRRLRAIQLKHWRRKRTIARKLIDLGVKRATAWRAVYDGQKSLWALSAGPATHRGLRNAYFAERGLESVVEKWREKNSEDISAPVQLKLALG